MGNWIRKRISLITTLSILAFFWILTGIYGTTEVQQSYVKLNRAPAFRLKLPFIPTTVPMIPTVSGI